MARLNQERQQRLEPSRMETALKELRSMDYVCESNALFISFLHKGHTVKYYPYSGWATGKTIKDGRGLKPLLDQLKGEAKDEN